MQSPNLNVITKAFNKISSRLVRDFGEIENLQNNHFSATKFANSCYERVKDDLVYNLTRDHPNYNIEFIDGQKIVNDKNSDYCYIICPIDGLLNLSRAIPYFSTFVALQKGGEVIAVAMVNSATNDLYICERGAGAYLNNRRIRVSNRKASDNAVSSVSDSKLIGHQIIKKLESDVKLNNCASLDIAYVASGRFDLSLNFKDDRIVSAVALLVKESGGSSVVNGDVVITSNGKII